MPVLAIRLTRLQSSPHPLQTDEIRCFKKWASLACLIYQILARLSFEFGAGWEISCACSLKLMMVCAIIRTHVCVHEHAYQVHGHNKVAQTETLQLIASTIALNIRTCRLYLNVSSTEFNSKQSTRCTSSTSAGYDQHRLIVILRLFMYMGNINCC